MKPPGEGEVHLWRFSLEAASPDGSTLSVAERARAARFHFERDRDRFLVGRMRLRTLLGAYLGIAPAALPLSEGPHGKPEIAGSPLRFNLAHTQGDALLGVAWEQEIGVDIERLRGDFDIAALARAAFAPDECEAVGEDAAAFFRVWTLKEAYVKGLGCGLIENTRAFSVLKGVPPPWTLQELSLGPELFGAVALCGPLNSLVPFLG